MTNPISLTLQPRQELTQKQTQRLIMSVHMQQALNLLQMPIQELATAIEAEIKRNPILEMAIEEIEGDREINLDEEVSAEKSLEFSDQNFDILSRLDADFSDHFAESRTPQL